MKSVFIFFTFLSLFLASLWSHAHSVKGNPFRVHYVDAIDGGTVSLNRTIVFPENVGAVFFQIINGRSTISARRLLKDAPYCYLQRSSKVVMQLLKGESFLVQTQLEPRIESCGHGCDTGYLRRSDLKGAANSKIDSFVCYNGQKAYPENTMNISLQDARDLVGPHLILNPANS